MVTMVGLERGSLSRFHYSQAIVYMYRPFVAARIHGVAQVTERSTRPTPNKATGDNLIRDKAPDVGKEAPAVAEALPAAAVELRIPTDRPSNGQSWSL